MAALDELQAGQGQVLAAQDAGFADLKAELAVLRAGLAASAGGGAAAASAWPFAGLTPPLPDQPTGVGPWFSCPCRSEDRMGKLQGLPWG